MRFRTCLRFIATILGVLACSGEQKPGAGTDAAPAATSSPDPAAPSDPRAAIFLTKGCPQCHSVAALGIKSPAEIGPDLTMADADVPTRFGVKLKDFLHDPTGTMQIVFSSQIQLSPSERDSLIQILKEIHEESRSDEDDDAASE